jgi:hypothetical protein
MPFCKTFMFRKLRKNLVVVERKFMKIMYAAACTKTHQRHMCYQKRGLGVGGDQVRVHPSQR